MSEDKVLEFLRSVVEDPSLKARVENASDADALLAISRDAGYAFAADDLLKVLHGHEAYGNRLELSRPELETVVGGRRSTNISSRDDLSRNLRSAGSTNPCTSATPVTCITYPDTFAGDTCNCTVFASGCD